MTQNIKELYHKVTDKVDFILLCSDHFKIKPQSIRNNWFNGFYSIPDKHQQEVVKILQNYIKQQQHKTQIL